MTGVDWHYYLGIVLRVLLWSAWLVVVFSLFWWWCQRKQFGKQSCQACGYHLWGIVAGAVCPECGYEGTRWSRRRRIVAGALALLVTSVVMGYGVVLWLVAGHMKEMAVTERWAANEGAPAPNIAPIVSTGLWEGLGKPDWLRRVHGVHIGPGGGKYLTEMMGMPYVHTVVFNWVDQTAEYEPLLRQPQLGHVMFVNCGSLEESLLSALANNEGLWHVTLVNTDVTSGQAAGRLAIQVLFVTGQPSEALMQAIGLMPNLDELRITMVEQGTPLHHSKHLSQAPELDSITLWNAPIDEATLQALDEVGSLRLLTVIGGSSDQLSQREIRSRLQGVAVSFVLWESTPPTTDGGQTD